jgi:hypothetical protein
MMELEQEEEETTETPTEAQGPAAEKA